MALPQLTPNQIEQIARIMGDTDGDERGPEGLLDRPKPCPMSHG